MMIDDKNIKLFNDIAVLNKVQLEVGIVNL